MQIYSFSAKPLCTMNFKGDKDEIKIGYDLQGLFMEVSSGKYKNRKSEVLQAINKELESVEKNKEKGWENRIRFLETAQTVITQKIQKK